MLGTARLILVLSGLLTAVGGLVVLVAGGKGAFIGGLTLVIIGVALVGTAALERLRYRSDADDRSGASARPGPAGGEPPGPLEPRFERTSEVFVDPASQLRTRVFIDRRTGERRYQAED